MLLLYRGETFDSNFFYHSGVDLDHGFLFPEKNLLFVPKMNEQIARKSFRGKVRTYSTFKDIEEFIKGKKVEADLASLSARLANRLKKSCALRDATVELRRKRAVKKSHEVSKIRKAAKLTRELIASLDFSVKTELDLEKQIKLRTIELGLEPAFDPIIASGPSTAFPHYRAGRKKLQSHILIDYGLRVDHYCSDITRCIILDRKRKSEYEKLENICHTIIDELPELRTGSAVAKFSEKLIKKEGFPHLIHSIGHGVGLEVHELPSLGMKSRDRIKGATLAIEPAFYYEKYGMRFEETVYFDGKKAKIL